MKVAICSDLHLEFHNLPDSFFTNKEKANVLLICGDVAEIKNYPELAEPVFDRLSDLYERVLVIPGNHEGYCASLEQVDDVFSELDRHFENIFFDPDAMSYGDVEFIGTTLWTNFNKGDPNVMLGAQYSMNDYRLIKLDGRRLKPKDTFNFFKSEFNWLEGSITRSKMNKIVVFTHHGPSWKSISGSYVDDEMNAAYVSELSNFILDNPKIKVWAHGHVHSPIQYDIGETRVIVNPRGYKPYTFSPEMDDYINYQPVVVEV